MSLRQEVKARAEAASAGPQRRWGQNFLVREDVLDRIADAAVRGASGGVVEIGPGPGTLTERLARRAERVVALERDPRWAAFLTDLFDKAPHVRIVQADAVKVTLASLTDAVGPWALAGNIPYNLTGPLLIGAFEARNEFRSATFMVQSEVADRLTAAPNTKAYGTVSVLLQRAGTVERIMRVPAASFWPAPKVSSAVIRVTFDKGLDSVAGAHLRKTVRWAFGQRRKTLRNALSAAVGREVVADLERASPVDLGRRAETLDLAEFDALSAAVARVSPEPDPALPADPS